MRTPWNDPALYLLTIRRERRFMWFSAGIAATSVTGAAVLSSSLVGYCLGLMGNGLIALCLLNHSERLRADQKDAEARLQANLSRHD